MSNHIIQSPKIYSVRSDPTLLPHCRGGSVHRTDILCVLIGAQYSPLILILLQTSALITLCFLSQSSQLQTTPLICETEPSDRMAKTAKRLNAILDYMKKVKSSISMVSHPPTPGLMICQTSLCGLTFRYRYHYVWVLVVIKGHVVRAGAGLYRELGPTHRWSELQ